MKKIWRSLWTVTPVLALMVAFNFVPLSAGGTLNAPRFTTTTIHLSLPHAFTPSAPRGGHDLYHCSLLDPKVTTDQMITGVLFTPGNTVEDHHAILYWVPAALASAARLKDNGGKGWTCFGGTGIGSTGSVADLGATAWLGAWSPGHGATVEPSGTGVPLPKGSLIVMQVHYNLLQGRFPDRSRVTLTTTSNSSGLTPLRILLLPAPMDLACPKGQTGTLCSRTASLADIGHRFGRSAEGFDSLLEEVCHNGSPVISTTATCTWPMGAKAYIWDVTAHMHLLGSSFKVTLNPGTSKQRVLLNVPNYDFHYQRSYPLANPVLVGPSDKIQVSCTYNPLIRSQDPYLKSLPPRFVLWADGSSDEMCLAILGETSVLPAGIVPSAHPLPSAPMWPAALAKAASQSPAAFLGTNHYLPFGDSALRQRNLRQALLNFPLCS